MKVKYKIKDLNKKISSKLNINEKRYFDGFIQIPQNLSLTYKKNYTVLGLDYLEDGSIDIMISDDTGVNYPKFYPIDFFEIIDRRSSKYWFNKNFELFNHKIKIHSKLVSFERAVQDDYFFDDLLENRNYAQQTYEKFRILMENEFPDSDLNYAEKIDDSWIMCSKCDDVWEGGKEQGIVICAKNGHRNNNPNWVNKE
jgi:hypothetical protein